MQVAQKGIEELASTVDSLITIPNEKLLTVLGRNVSLLMPSARPTTCCSARCRASPT
jgi:cell division protein FtsZ